jgi:hypothetical protein
MDLSRCDPSCNSSKDPPNVIYTPKLDAPSNFSTSTSKNWNFQLKLKILAYESSESEKTSSPFERASNFGVEMKFFE